MRRLVAILPLAILAALALLFATFGLHHDPHFTPDALVGQSAPDAVLPHLDGSGPAHLAGALKGPVLVNFFFSTCPPCIEEAPALMALKSQGVRLVGVAYKEPPADTQGFLSRFGNPFAEVLVDRQGRAAIDWGVSGAPETFLVAADGKVLAKHSGALTPADADALLERMSSPTSR
ncbi:redoxin family protein [Caulobacter sp. S45]|uniref:redoxin family protein n=1 Tax=Caulobacter sp. S45 TaxID=1641861 RepID=UPI001577236E|nr:redoxin family protein [Caulobacter sp. S45]